MKVFLARQNGLHNIIDMIIYLAGGISGNLKPAWKRMVGGEDISDIGFIKALHDENFWQGGNLGTGCMRFRQRKKMI